MTDIKRVLVANRGEIALRIIRACHEEGMEAVAVYSEVDRLSPHVRAADAAVALGPAPAAESYLDAAKLVAAARHSGCQAIHPGYGFLSERAPFAEAVTEAGLTFVGPSAAAIRAMGDKTEARRRMQAAGVPIVPGTMRPLADHAQARPEAARLGYPVLLEAAAGGGGKGMRLVREEAELEAGFEAAASEALKAFGAGEVYLEKYLERPRHIELQILADSFGRVAARGGPGVRWDGGIEAGNEVTLHYDPLIAKLIVWGETRAVALERMRRALRELTIVGIPSSQAFHLRVMDDPEFQRGDIDVTYLERAGERLLVGEQTAELTRPLAVVAALLAEERRAAAPPPAPAPSAGPPV